MTENILRLSNITKSFGDTQVLRGISLDIEKGEFITFLGSSGCGKTTTLRIIAGLESPDSGSVILGGQDVTTAQPNHRDVNTIFQNYALFPHMNVYNNIAYS
ncbi:MAG: ABC transporter ATP-binding protein, partial [Angelakisella sp.]